MGVLFSALKNGEFVRLTRHSMSDLIVRLGLVALLGLAGGIAHGEDWPHWRGAQRNGTTSESSRWEEGGWQKPREHWRVAVGEGSSSPLVVAGHVYTLGWADGQEQISRLDTDSGRVDWRQAYRAPQYGRRSDGDKGLYSGPSATPEYDPLTGRLYTLGSDGELQCREAATGKLVWRRPLYDEFEVPQRPKVGRSGRRDYGCTSAPVVAGEMLVVEIGAATGCLVGFDKRDGRTLWQSQSKSPAGHTGGPVPLSVQGVPCVAVHNFDGLLVTRLDPEHLGETVAEFPWRTEFANNIASLTVCDDSVLLTSHYNQQKTARIRVTLRGAERVWEQNVASKVCSPVVRDGHVYLAWQEVICLDFDTGRIRWRGGRTGDPGSCIATADDRIIVWSGRGTLSLVDSARRSPDRYHELSSHPVLSNTDAWPHVVLSRGRLYCKDRGGALVCLDLSAMSGKTPTEK
jgi:outer membrane protein assembly factor BamB